MTTKDCESLLLLLLLLFFSRSVMSDSLQPPVTAAPQASLSFTISQNLLKLMSIELVKSSKHLILCFSLFLPSTFPSIRVFSSELALHIRWPKYWSFSFSTSPSNEYSGLITFRIYWFDLLAVQRTLKSLQHHDVEASVFRHSAAFVVQLSHLYMTAGETVAFIAGPLSAERLCLILGPRFFNSFPSKEQASLNVIAAFGAQENKICHRFHFFPYLHEAMRWGCYLFFEC